MITKIKYLLLLSAIWLVGCTKESPDEAKETKYVSLKIHFNSGSAVTRSNTDNQHPLGKTKIWDAAIYFYRGTSRNILSIYQLTAADIASINTALSAGPNATGTLTINKVPVTADNMFFVANYTASKGDTYPYLNEATTSTGIDAVSGATITINTQMKDSPTDNSAESVVMSGKTTITISSDDTKFIDASITIAPLVARLEIGSITAKGINESGQQVGDIVSYTIDGIYINQYYYKSNLLGEHRIGDYANTIKPVDNGQITAQYSSTFSFPEGNYDPTYSLTKMYVESFSNGDSDGDRKVAAGSSKVWAFQMYESNPAHIIIRLKNILYDNGAGGTTNVNPFVQDAVADTPMYLVVDSYRHGSTNDLITIFDAGKVYRLPNIDFKATDLGTPPYAKLQLFSVTVSVLDWSEATIETEYE